MQKKAENATSYLDIARELEAITRTIRRHAKGFKKPVEVETLTLRLEWCLAQWKAVKRNAA